MCSHNSLYYPNSSTKIPYQALNGQVYRRARAWGYFLLVELFPFISIPSRPLNLFWLCRATPDPHKGKWTPDSPQAADHFPLSLWSHTDLFVSTPRAHTALLTTAHAITGRETQSRSTATHHLMGQIEHCNFLQAKAAASGLCQDIFKQKKHYKQVEVICNRIRQKVPQLRYRVLVSFF